MPARIRILLVEHDQPDTGRLRRLLSATGNGAYHVEEAKGLADALLRLSRGGIEVIVLDSALPGRPQGIAALARVAPRALVLVFSAAAEGGIAWQTVGDDAHGLISKHETVVHELPPALSELIAHRRTQDAGRVAHQRSALSIDE